MPLIRIRLTIRCGHKDHRAQAWKTAEKESSKTEKQHAWRSERGACGRVATFLYDCPRFWGGCRGRGRGSDEMETSCLGGTKRERRPYVPTRGVEFASRPEQAHRQHKTSNNKIKPSLLCPSRYRPRPISPPTTAPLLLSRPILQVSRPTTI